MRPARGAPGICLLGRGISIHDANFKFPITRNACRLGPVAKTEKPAPRQERFMETYFNNITPQENGKDRLVADLGRVVKDAEALLMDAGEKLPEKTRDQLRKAVDQIKEKYEAVQERAKAGAQSTERLVREHPYEALGAAFGVGLLIGLLINKN